MDDHKLKTYRLVEELAAHLGDVSYANDLHEKLIDLKTELEVEAGRSALAKERGGLLINGAFYCLTEEEQKSLSVRDKDGYLPKIPVIKAVRIRTGLCLVDAKNLVEFYMDRLNLF